MSRTLLIEVGTEDLPARYVLPLADALRDGITQGPVSYTHLTLPTKA